MQQNASSQGHSIHYIIILILISAFPAYKTSSSKQKPKKKMQACNDNPTNKQDKWGADTHIMQGVA